MSHTDKGAAFVAVRQNLIDPTSTLRVEYEFLKTSNRCWLARAHSRAGAAGVAAPHSSTARGGARPPNPRVRCGEGLRSDVERTYRRRCARCRGG
jgi:hypothetical protein